MTSISYNPDRSDVDESSVATKVIAVGTTAVELFTGVSRNPTRQIMIIYNDSDKTIYLGPSTVTISGATKGQPLLKDQMISVPLGNVAYYAITDAANKNVILTEFA